MSSDGRGEPGADRRRAPRKRCLRGGRCVFNQGASALDVTIRNISASGARISGDELMCLPETFELWIHDGFGGYDKRAVRLAWVRVDAAGLAFFAPEAAANRPPD